MSTMECQTYRHLGLWHHLATLEGKVCPLLVRSLGPNECSKFIGLLRPVAVLLPRCPVVVEVAGRVRRDGRNDGMCGVGPVPENDHGVARSPRWQISGRDEAVVIEPTESVARFEKRDLPLTDLQLLGTLEGLCDLAIPAAVLPSLGSLLAAGVERSAVVRHG